jgi:hypothetical protein
MPSRARPGDAVLMRYPAAVPGATAYPRDREAEILLRDGSTAHVRPVRRDDGEAIRTFLKSGRHDRDGNGRYRGAPRCDVQAVEEVLLRISAMVEAHPEIVELDCNPLIAGPDGALIVHAPVRVEPAPPMPSIQG